MAPRALCCLDETPLEVPYRHDVVAHNEIVEIVEEVARLRQLNHILDNIVNRETQRLNRARATRSPQHGGGVFAFSKRKVLRLKFMLTLALFAFNLTLILRLTRTKAFLDGWNHFTEELSNRYMHLLQVVANGTDAKNWITDATPNTGNTLLMLTMLIEAAILSSAVVQLCFSYFRGTTALFNAMIFVALFKIIFITVGIAVLFFGYVEESTRSGLFPS